MKAPLEIVALGGLGEFGRNLLWLRSRGSSLLVDIGVSFPDETFPGVDRIAPDLSALKDERIEAVLLTHGHEDHIGSLPLLREFCAAPVYGFPFTLAMARRRLEEAERPTSRGSRLRSAMEWTSRSSTRPTPNGPDIPAPNGKPAAVSRRPSPGRPGASF